jgi:hypothetical protein
MGKGADIESIAATNWHFREFANMASCQKEKCFINFLKKINEKIECERFLFPQKRQGPKTLPWEMLGAKDINPS